MKDIDGIEHVLATLRPHWSAIEDDFNRHNRRFLTLAAADHDPIGRVLRTHLVVENFLDSFLSSRFDIDDLPSVKLSFFQKAMLLPKVGSSASFVRPGILQLNTVRNKFGHRLDHTVKKHEISAVYEVLQVARRDHVFDSAVDALEAFGPVACAFLSVAPQHLEDVFVRAFARVRSDDPVGV